MQDCRQYFRLDMKLGTLGKVEFDDIQINDLVMYVDFDEESNVSSTPIFRVDDIQVNTENGQNCLYSKKSLLHFVD